MTENFAQAAEFKNLRLSFLAKMWANKTLNLITCPHRHSIAFQMQCRLPQLLFSVIFQDGILGKQCYFRIVVFQVKSGHFLAIFLEDNFIPTSFRGFFFLRADACSHYYSKNVSHLNSNWSDGQVSQQVTAKKFLFQETLKNFLLGIQKITV